MKTIILTTVLAVLAAVSVAQFPQSQIPDSCCYFSDDLRVAIFQINDSTVHLKMAKNPGELVKIRVKEGGHNLLYSRRVKSHGAADLIYDIHQFPQGEYVFEIVKDKKVVYSQKVKRENVSGSFIATK